MDEATRRGLDALARAFGIDPRSVYLLAGHGVTHEWAPGRKAPTAARRSTAHDREGEDMDLAWALGTS
ncbi:MAG: hypothetical protein IJ092_05555 [Atopobiaceae bacterium]|nr:hypothetical protein [Atopobiaceae bacterium]